MTMTPERAKELLANATPGPWAVLKFSQRMTITGNIHQVVDGSNFPSAFVPAWDDPGHGETDGSVEAIANAVLISATPDLVQAYLTSEAARIAAEAKVEMLREAMEIELAEAVKQAEAELAEQNTMEVAMDYPMQRKMTLAMRRADRIRAALQETSP